MSSRDALQERRRELRADIAATRVAMGAQVRRLRGDIGMTMLAAAIVRLVPGRLRWIAVVAGVIAALRRR